MLYELLTTITTLSLNLIEQSGYFGIFAISFLENVFTPIPSEAVIPFAGVLVSQGRFDLSLVILAATAGSLAGAYVFYGFGYMLGSHRVRAWIVRWGRYVFVSETDLDRAEHWFAKYEDWAVLVCRIVPLVRSFISIPAGYVKMPILKFTVLTALGTAIWSSFLVYLGIALGNSYTAFIPVFRKLDLVFAGLVFILVMYYVFAKLRSRKTV